MYKYAYKQDFVVTCDEAKKFEKFISFKYFKRFHAMYIIAVSRCRETWFETHIFFPHSVCVFFGGFGRF